MILFRHRHVRRSARCALAALLLGFIGLVISPANAATKVWNSTGASQDWLTTGNWTGGTPGAADIGSFDGTKNPSDGNVGFSGSTSFGAISLSLTASSITFGSTGNGGSRALTINGATVNAVANTIFADTTTAGTTLTIIPQISGNKTLALTLGNTANVIQASSGNTIDLQTGLGEATAASTLTFQGGGLLIFNAANSYTGLTTITAGTLREGISDAISTGGLTVNGSTAVFDLGANHSDTVGTVTLQGGGSITGTGASTLTSTGTFEMQSGSVSAILAGSGIALNKTTSGTVTLSGANTYTGATSVSAGVLNIQNATALGTTAAGTSVTSGAALEVQGGIAVGAEALTLNGAGISSGGALRNISGNNSYAGLITLGSATRINSDSGTLTLDVASGNAITGTQNLTFGGAGNVTVNDPIATSTGTLTKDGAGTLTLAGANTYTGGTSVTAGTLLVNGSTASGSAVTVNGSGTTLGGTGTIGGTVAVSSTAAGAIVNPGANSTTAGTLTTGALTLSSTNANTIHIDAFGTAAINWDKLVSTAAIALGNTASTLQVNIASGLTFTAGQTYVLLDGTSLTGTFNGINDNDLVTFSGYQFTADYTGTEFDLIAVPEPSTWFAAALALGAIGFAQRKRVRNCARVINECVSRTVPNNR